MTRLRYEQMLSKNFTNLTWIRAHTSGEFQITIYACDNDLELSRDSIESLQEFLEHHGMVSCRHTIKHYFELRNDNVFPIGEIPDEVKHLALTSGITEAGVMDCIDSTFTMLDSSSIKIDGNVVYISVKENFANLELTAAKIYVIEMLLNEILPMGSISRIVKKPYSFESTLPS